MIFGKNTYIHTQNYNKIKINIKENNKPFKRLKEMFLNPVKAGEFDDEVKGFVPSEGEVRYIANKNTQCGYYLQGIEQCRRKIAKISDGSPELQQFGFLPCKRLVDAHYRCMTDDKYGNTIEEVPEAGQGNA